MNSITPEMLLGALVVFALVLLAFAILATVWARSAFRFGRDFKHFNARRDRGAIVVEATFTDRGPNAGSGSSSLAKVGDWLNGRSAPPAGPQ